MRAVLWVAVAFSASFALAAEDAKPTAGPPLPPELKVFERSIGTWDREMHIFPSEATKTEQRLKGHEKHEWILGGRYLQVTLFKPDGQLDGLILNTYDTEKRSYQGWQFAEKFNLNSQGAWDEKSQTMTWNGVLSNGLITKGTIRYVDKDTRAAQFETRGTDGKLHFKMETKMTRRK